ncbi:MAG: GNAT family N-acetyltransferase [Chitinophagaceae bacterium]|nr:GNAT family N-acetyltransferase [Chitinophagaceae bacterium]
MIRIERANLNDVSVICHIGYAEVEAAHRASCAPDILSVYLNKNYNEEAIRTELLNARNLYHVLWYNNEPVGFSKIVLHQHHPNIKVSPSAKLDRIYVSSAFHDKKLGAALLQYNIELAKQHGQQGLWLFTWIGNERAIRFYTKFGFEIVGSHWFEVSETHSNENHHMLLRWE